VSISKPDPFTVLEALPHLASEINRIAFDVLGDLPEPTQVAPGQVAPRARRGASKADPKNAERLLAAFAECVEHGLISAHKRVANRLLEHIRCSVRSYLDGDRRSLDAAFGVVPSKRGRRAKDQLTIAVKILRRRFKGEDYEKAVASDRDCARNTKTNAWRDQGVTALTLFMKERAEQGKPLTEEEKARLRYIYETEEDGLILPKGWSLEALGEGRVRLKPPPDAT
jgi:hypothetical protein